MKELLELVKTGFASPVNSLVTIILFIAAVKGIYEFIKWCKSELNSWYDQKHTSEEKEENVHERIKKLEENDAEQFKLMNKFDEYLVSIHSKLDEVSDNQKQEAIALTRASLNSMYPLLKEQGYMTKSQYETWRSLADIYLSRGGNHVFAEKIIPEINALNVKDI